MPGSPLRPQHPADAAVCGARTAAGAAPAARRVAGAAPDISADASSKRSPNRSSTHSPDAAPASPPLSGQTRSARACATACTALAQTLTRIEYACALFSLSLIPVLSIYANVTLPGWGRAGALLPLLGGVGVLWLGAYRPWRWKLPDAFVRAGAGFPRPLQFPPVRHVLLFGLALHVAVAALSAPIPQADGAAYLDLAEKLAHGRRYVDAFGHLAFWPAGLPLYLAPFVRLFGATPIAIAAANGVLYLLGAASVAYLAQTLCGHRAAAPAALLFTLWPGRLLLAGVVAKELLCLGLVAASLALLLAAFASPGPRAFIRALPAGAAMGWAALAQPGLLLLLLAYPPMFRAALKTLSWQRYLAILATTLLSAVLIVAPWMLRNCEVFSGQFCGVATNGGSVFYRANNPAASGSWIPEGEIAITHMPELEQNRLGFELGKQWLREQPLAALALAVRKEILLLGGDAYGAYWAIKRGDGRLDAGIRQDPDTPRESAYRAAKLLSLFFWIALGCMAIRGLRALRRRSREQTEAALPLLYPFLYGVAVFALFESGDRQHMFAVPPLIALALAHLYAPEEAGRGGPAGSETGRRTAQAA